MDLEILKNIPALSDVDEDDLADVVKKASTEKFSPDAVIFNEGDAGDKFYVIKSGKIEILRKNGDNEDEQIAILYPDNFFGEMALISDIPRNATAKCLEEVELLTFDKKDFYDILFL
jgi:CRP-like cAMP-binding protein